LLLPPVVRHEPGRVRDKPWPPRGGGGRDGGGRGGSSATQLSKTPSKTGRVTLSFAGSVGQMRAAPRAREETRARERRRTSSAVRTV
jgi:hypothetical protein